MEPQPFHGAIGMLMTFKHLNCLRMSLGTYCNEPSFLTPQLVQMLPGAARHVVFTSAACEPSSAYVGFPKLSEE